MERALSLAHSLIDRLTGDGFSEVDCTRTYIQMYYTALLYSGKYWQGLNYGKILNNYCKERRFITLILQPHVAICNGVH